MAELIDATLEDIQAKQTALMAECCTPLDACTCPHPPAGTVLSVPKREALQVIVDGVAADLVCDCGEPVYAVVNLGRHEQYCRTSINAIKVEAGKPVHPTDLEEYCWKLENVYGDDGFLMKTIRYDITRAALDEYITEKRIKRDGNGGFVLLPKPTD